MVLLILVIFKIGYKTSHLVADSRTKCKKYQFGNWWERCVGVTTTLTDMTNLPNVQVPQPSGTIPNLEPLESQKNHQLVRPVCVHRKTWLP
jgi:hypothetical protein